MEEKQVVLVTGGSRGIGRAIALKYAKNGYNVVLNYISENTDIEGLTKEFEAYGIEVLFVKADISKANEVEELVKQATQKFGRIDVLVNNAGITKDNLLMRMKESDFDAVIDVNLKGTWNCMKHAAKFMMKQRYGRIISMSSVVGVMGNAGQVNYSASKAGIIGMTMSLAREVGSRGITVNAIAPGFIQTAMTDVLPDEIKENMAKQIPLGTFGQVSDIANTVVFLASDDARYITGQTIHVDGGMAM